MDEFTHPPHRMTPRHAEAPLDVRPNLRAQAEIEAARRVRLQIPPEVGDGHRVACERDRNAGSDLETRRVFGSEHHRQERIVVDLARPPAVVATLFERADHLWDAAEF